MPSSVLALPRDSRFTPSGLPLSSAKCQKNGRADDTVVLAWNNGRADTEFLPENGINNPGFVIFNPADAPNNPADAIFNPADALKNPADVPKKAADALKNRADASTKVADAPKKSWFIGFRRALARWQT
jgi:hypothetical protein